MPTSVALASHERRASVNILYCSESLGGWVDSVEDIKRLPVALIGHGYWGRNIARVISQSPNFFLHTICDSQTEALSKAQKIYPHVKVVQNHEHISDAVKVVAIMTPANTHFGLARRFLEKRKHILVTKPFARRGEDARFLFSLAQKNNCTIFADHTFLFNPAVIEMKKLMPKIGKPYFILSQRLNMDFHQPDVNVILDLMPHDLSICCYLMNCKVKSAQTMVRTSEGGQENLAHASCLFENGVSGVLTSSWLSPLKIRQMMVVGSEGMLSYDDVAVSEKIKFFQKGVSSSNLSQELNPIDARVSYRTGSMFSPAVSNREALAIELETFHEAIASSNVRNFYERVTLNTVDSLDSILSAIYHPQKGIPTALWNENSIPLKPHENTVQ